MPEPQDAQEHGLGARQCIAADVDCDDGTGGGVARADTAALDARQAEPERQGWAGGRPGDLVFHTLEKSRPWFLAINATKQTLCGRRQVHSSVQP